MIYILAIIVVFILIDIYFRFRKIAGYVDYLRISEQLINRSLLRKQLLSSDDIKLELEEMKENTEPDEWARWKKSLKRVNIKIED